MQIELSSREYNKKWYTEVKAWKVEVLRDEFVINEQYRTKTPEDDLPF
jgi:hypothetical protein